jgi:hypothetical protein
LTVVELFRLGQAFDASRQPDGSIRVVHLVGKPGPVLKIKVNRDGSFECPPLMSRETIRATLRADRDAQ